LSPDQQQAMFDLLQANVQQNKGLREKMKSLQTQNHILMHHIVEMKNSLRCQNYLPSHVLLQQPVVLHDALSRIAPFHLEFIDSVAASFAVLQIRFEHVGRRKMKQLELELRDTARQTTITLRKTWNGVIRVCDLS
jgi:hypothetical protein